MKRLALIAALLMVALLPGAAQGAVYQWTSGYGSCNVIYNELGNPKPFVCLAEDIAYGGDKLILTASSDIANLGTLGHQPSGWCAPKLPGDTDNWNDCIDSVWAKLGTSDSVCLYREANYGGLHWRAIAPIAPAGGVWTNFDPDLHEGSEENISSIMVQQSGQPCNEGGVP